MFASRKRMPLRSPSDSKALVQWGCCQCQNCLHLLTCHRMHAAKVYCERVDRSDGRDMSPAQSQPSSARNLQLRRVQQSCLNRLLALTNWRHWSQGLKLLKQLLFGPRANGLTLEDFTVGGALPPAGAGLQLCGNRDDYYAPANSLLHKCDELMELLIERHDKPCHDLLNFINCSCVTLPSSCHAGCLRRGWASPSACR
jgi:hypothetical protein